MANDYQPKKKTLAVSMLAEGSSISSIERMAGIHRETVMRLGVRMGEGCKAIMDTKMRGIQSSHIEVDEIWRFIGAKRKNADRTGNYGDVWTFIAIDADTKASPLSWLANGLLTTQTPSLPISPRGCKSAFRFPDRK